MPKAARDFMSGDRGLGPLEFLEDTHGRTPQCLLAPTPQCLSTSGLLGTVEKGQPRAPGMRPEGMCFTWEVQDAG